MAVETAAVAAPADVSSLRVAFGSAPFSVPVLAELLEAGHAVVAVYTQPPRPAGRGYRTRRSPVQVYAESCGLCVRTPKTLRHAEEQRLFAELGLDAAVVAAYGLILPKPILAAPRLGCLNVHASLLPRWRGAAPIERRSSRATTRPASASCRWTRGSIPARYCSPPGSRSGQKRQRQACTIHWRTWGATADSGARRTCCRHAAGHAAAGRRGHVRPEVGAGGRPA